MKSMVCISTKKQIVNDTGAVRFPCPGCADYEIVRSSFAKKNAIKYHCPACNFTGPN